MAQQGAEQIAIRMLSLTNVSHWSKVLRRLDQLHAFCHGISCIHLPAETLLLCHTWQMLLAGISGELGRLHALCHGSSRLLLLLPGGQAPLLRGIVANLEFASSEALEHARTELIAWLAVVVTAVAACSQVRLDSRGNQLHEADVGLLIGMPARG